MYIAHRKYMYRSNRDTQPIPFAVCLCTSATWKTWLCCFCVYNFFFAFFVRSFIHSFNRAINVLYPLHTQPNSWEQSVKVNVQEKLFEFLLLLPSGFLLFTCIIYKETYTHLTLLCLRIMWFSSNGAIPWTVNALFCEHMESESLCFFFCSVSFSVESESQSRMMPEIELHTHTHKTVSI